MGRKKKGSALQERINKYLAEYELDEMNTANDMAALTQMCQLELNMQQIQEALENINPLTDSKMLKELHSSLRDANQSWTSLQNELGINKRKRTSESDETPLKYIERLQEQAKKYVEMRFKVLKCKCGQPLAKYFIYVPEKGEAGSIEYESKPVQPYSYTFEVECWKCGGTGIDTNK